MLRQMPWLVEVRSQVGMNPDHANRINRKGRSRAIGKISRLEVFRPIEIRIDRAVHAAGLVQVGLTRERDRDHRTGNGCVQHATCGAIRRANLIADFRIPPVRRHGIHLDGQDALGRVRIIAAGNQMDLNHVTNDVAWRRSQVIDNHVVN